MLRLAVCARDARLSLGWSHAGTWTAAWSLLSLRLRLHVPACDLQSVLSRHPPFNHLRQLLLLLALLPLGREALLDEGAVRRSSEEQLRRTG